MRSRWIIRGCVVCVQGLIFIDFSSTSLLLLFFVFVLSLSLLYCNFVSSTLFFWFSRNFSIRSFHSLRTTSNVRVSGWWSLFSYYARIIHPVGLSLMMGYHYSSPYSILNTFSLDGHISEHYLPFRLSFVSIR